MDKTTESKKLAVVSPWGGGKKYWMSSTEYTGVIVGKEQSDGEYVISDGVIGPDGFIPDHYHLWEDQTFHILAGTLEAKVGAEHFTVGPGATIHCPRGVSHFMKNIGESEARVISYIFPGHWAEAFMAETSRQNHAGAVDLARIEREFGVIYI